MEEYIRKILVDMPVKKASDLHIGAEAPLHYRINTELAEIDKKALSGMDAKKTIYSFLTPDEVKRFEEEKELDFSFSIEGVGRFRANAFWQREKVGCAIRFVPPKVMTIEECGLPQDVVRMFCNAPKGLVLVTGPTGSGKSTSLAAMIDEINQTQRCHIITVEDPIEFVHENKKSIIEQRQVLDDTHSFANALKFALRQDPDVILVGEMRDLDTIQQALIIADTGHLVFGTLHTPDSIQSINRMVDVFPPHQQRQIRVQLSMVLLGVLSQQLLARKDKHSMVLATEVLVATNAIRSLIRDSKEYQGYSIIQTSQKIGMKTMNQALAELCDKDLITKEEAISRSSNVEELLKLI